MKILIVGGDGMLGHQLLDYFLPNYDVKVSLRQKESAYQQFGDRFTPQNSYFGVDVVDTDSVAKVLKAFKPDAVINAVGIVKQRKTAKEVIPSLKINALFPHQLAEFCAEINARMVTMSTDCIFAGDRGNYQPDDFSDAYDLYGRTKYLGEVHEPHCVTIRSSIIGLELHNHKSLIEWFLAQQSEIKGFTKAIYTGITTLEMAKIIEKIFLDYKQLSGISQIASEKIDKYTLLTNLATKLGRTDITIVPDTQFYCDRSLDGSEFVKKTGYVVPSWDMMLDQLAEQINERRARG